MTRAAGHVRRETLASALGDMLQRARADPGLVRASARAKPAGVPIEIRSNDERILNIYRSRLPSAPEPDGGASWLIRVIVAAADSVPVWDDWACTPEHFQRLLAERGLRAAYPYQPGVWQILDTRRRVGLLLLRSAAELPPWDFGAPLRQHLHWILREHGGRLTHASTLGRDGVGVVFFGNSGAGKSGLALAGLSLGLQTVGDDYVALSAAGGVRASTLFTIVKQDRAGLSRVPELAGRCRDLPENWKGKLEIPPGRLPPGAFAAEMAVRAAVLPRIADTGAPRLVPCGPGRVMRALMRSNLHQYPGEDEDGMAFFAHLLRQLPTFELELSTDFQRNGRCVQSLIAGLSTPAQGAEPCPQPAAT